MSGPAGSGSGLHLFPWPEALQAIEASARMIQG